METRQPHSTSHSHSRTVSNWFRRMNTRPTTSRPEQQDSPASTANSLHFTPPPAVEALPPYSPPAEDLAIATLPVPHADPPPDYQPASPNSNFQPLQHNPPPPPSPSFSRAEELAHLKDVFSRLPWRRAWGPQPTTIAHTMNKAALLGHHRLILALLDLGVEVRGNQHQAIQTTTPVHEALRGPEPWLAQALIGRLCAAGGDADEFLESRDAAGCTPLHIAAEAGETSIAQGFILQGAQVDAVDKLGRTPLHMAARYGRSDTMDMLLSCGANPGLVNEKLWMWSDAHPKRGELLGSYKLISSAVRDAVERLREAHGRDIDGFESQGADGADDGEDNPTAQRSAPDPARYTQTLQPLIAASAGAGRQSRDPLRPSLPPNRPPRPRLHRGSLHGRSPSDPTAERLAVAYGHNEAEAVERVLKHLSGASTSQREVPSMLFSPEYAIWKKDCETLQSESKAQKKKNRRETGNALDLY